jgi:hypothetical protein
MRTEGNARNSIFPASVTFHVKHSGRVVHASGAVGAYLVILVS